MTPKQFLTELKAHDKTKYEIVSRVHDLILDADKKVSEEIKYGGLLYSNTNPYTGLFVSKHHVSMEFSNGAEFDDPNQVLQGSGKYRRHLKFVSPEDIDEKQIKKFLKQATSMAK